MKKQTGGFTRTINIDILQHINEENSNLAQETLACELKKGETGNSLKHFIIQIFVSYCFKLKDVFIKHYNLDEEGNNPRNGGGESKSSSLSYSYNKFNLREYFVNKLTQQVENNTTITDIAFSPEEASTITNIILHKRINSREETNKTKLTNYMTRNFKEIDRIHSVLGGINMLNDEPQQAFLILEDPELSLEFITELRLLYNLPDTYTLVDFKSFFDKKIKEDNPPYYIFRLVTKLTGLKTSNKGIIQKNYGREIFVRDRANLETPSIKEIPECFQSMKTNSQQTHYKDISNYYDVDNTFHGEIFKHFGRKYVGGVSGTFFYLHFLVFKILKYPKNFETYAKAICTSVLDYVPIWHSLEEILLSASIEIEKNIQKGSREFPGFKRYTLDMNPISYFKNLLTLSYTRGPQERPTQRQRAHSIGGKRKTKKRKQKKRKTKKNKRKRKINKK